MVNVGHAGIANSEVRFHKLRRVFFSCDDRERSNLCNAISVGRFPVLVLDGHQPHFGERFDQCAARSLVCFGRVACWIRIKMPEHSRFCELTHRSVGQDLASDVSRSLTHRLACVPRNSNALRCHLCA